MKTIFVVAKQSFWAGSGTHAIASFTNKTDAQKYADEKQDRTDLRNGCQCFVMSRTAFNKKYGIHPYSSNSHEKYAIEADGSLSSLDDGEQYEFINYCR